MMRSLRYPALFAALAVFAASCANQAEPEAEATPAATQSAADAPAAQQDDDEETAPPGDQFADDGLRLPDMRVLPSERELQRRPADAATDDGGGVRARPPTTPPSRPRSSDG